MDTTNNSKATIEQRFLVLTPDSQQNTNDAEPVTHELQSIKQELELVRELLESEECTTDMLKKENAKLKAQLQVVIATAKAALNQSRGTSSIGGGSSGAGGC